MSNTINNSIPFVPENTIDPAAGLNLALNTIDALLQLLVITVGANTPPTGVEGNRYIVGTSPTGAWSGQANKLARFLDGAWHFYSARYALNVADGLWYVRSASTWAPLAGGGGGEANTASNIGAGQGVFASKVGVDLRFKSLVAGTNVSLSADGNTITINASGGGGSGTVTSVGLSAPTGFDVSGSPVTASGTLALSFSTGYSLPTNTNQSNWSTAFGWGDHASAGYEKQLMAGANITIDRTDPDNPVISASASSGMTNPMTTAGDLIVGGTSGTPMRLTKGVDESVLTVVAGTPTWVLQSFAVDYLVVGGGGGGGGNAGAGGGAGGYLSGQLSVRRGDTYPVIIGAGGSLGASNSAGGKGGNSTFSTVVSEGGGGGGSFNNTTPGNGGSGGGGGGRSTGSALFGTGLSGQGNNGGTGSIDPTAQSANLWGGGGGGSSSGGGNATTTSAGSAGSGTSSSITGTAVTRAAGGAGGGGASASSGASGAANSGNGGGGGGSGSNGGVGGSGIVVISYEGSQKATGGTITTNGTKTVHTFTTSGNLVVGQL